MSITSTGSHSTRWDRGVVMLTHSVGWEGPGSRACRLLQSRGKWAPQGPGRDTHTHHPGSALAACHKCLLGYFLKQWGVSHSLSPLS